MSRLSDEYNAADRHDLDEIESESVPSGAFHHPRHSSSCACGWESDLMTSRALAQQEHDTHQDVQLGLAGTRTVWRRP